MNSGEKLKLSQDAFSVTKGAWKHFYQKVSSGEKFELFLLRSSTLETKTYTFDSKSANIKDNCCIMSRCRCDNGFLIMIHITITSCMLGEHFIKKCYYFVLQNDQKVHTFFLWITCNWLKRGWAIGVSTSSPLGSLPLGPVPPAGHF